MKKEIVSFSFGENWLDFIKEFDKERYKQAKQSMIDMLGGPGLEGKTFIDIGCGSGMFSLAAIELGAKLVLSVDVDSKSILACQKIKEMSKAENWQILQKSILNEKYLQECGKFDVVYSWGVLHHTGAMWRAIDNASALVAEGGIFAVAIYNRTVTAPFWLRFKRFYNIQTFFLVKKLMVYSIFIPRLIIRILKMSNLYTVGRGMSLYHDAVDWAGGLPYEYAGFEEIVSFVQEKGFKLVKGNRTKRTGCNEFMFLKI